MFAPYPSIRKLHHAGDLARCGQWHDIEQNRNSFQRRRGLGVLLVTMPFPRLVQTKESPSADALGERSDDDLMTLARAEHREAFAVLGGAARRAGSAPMWARFVNHGPLGRELAQDTWVLVWQAREKYRAEGAFVPWLVTVARNHCRNHARKAKTYERPRRSGRCATELCRAARRPLDRRAPASRAARVVRTCRPDARGALTAVRGGPSLRRDDYRFGTGESTLRSRVHHGRSRLLKQKLESE